MSDKNKNRNDDMGDMGFFLDDEDEIILRNIWLDLAKEKEQKKMKKTLDAPDKVKRKGKSGSGK